MGKSKLDYLSKYADDDGIKSKKKKKKRSRHREPVDDDLSLPPIDDHPDDDNPYFVNEEEREEDPVVVQSEELGVVPQDVPSHSSAAVERRRESSDDEKPARRYDSSDDESGEKMSSGHKAGLQSGHLFSKHETKLQQARHAEAQAMVDQYGMGDTVYRDKDGKIVSEEEARKHSQKKRRRQLTEAEQADLNQGRAQKLRREREQQEYARLQESTFAQYKDDDRLEAMRKQEIRAEDPMAALAAAKSQRSSKPSRPVYKGPPPKPNRFNLRPGYRWDGNDRGNGFEDRMLAKKYSAKHRREQSYKYSAADM